MRDSLANTLKKYFRFGGRSGRREFWIWTITMLLVSAVILGVLVVLGTILNYRYIWALSATFKVLLISFGIFWVFMFFPTLTVTVRRLRDAGITPWALIVPAALGIYTFLVLFEIGLSNMDGSTANHSDTFAFILSAITAIVVFIFLFLFCLPSKK